MVDGICSARTHLRALSFGDSGDPPGHEVVLRNAVTESEPTTMRSSPLADLRGRNPQQAPLLLDLPHSAADKPTDHDSRQAEWDYQVERLDQTEMELHQKQLKLMREQTATLIRDLYSVQSEVAVVKAQQEAAHADLCAVVNELKARVGSLGGCGSLTMARSDDFSTLCTQLRQEVDRRLTMQKESLDNQLERHVGQLEEGTRSLSVRYIELQARLARLEHDTGEERRGRGAAMMAGPGLMAQVGSLQAKVDDLAEVVATPPRQQETLARHHAAVESRVDGLERKLADMSRSIKEGGASAAIALGQRPATTEGGAVFEPVAEPPRGQATADEAQRSVLQRQGFQLDHRLHSTERGGGGGDGGRVSPTFGSEGRFQATDTLESQRLLQLMEELRVRDERNAALAERLHYMEAAVMDLVKKHTQELESANAKVEALRHAIASEHIVPEDGARLGQLERRLDHDFAGVREFLQGEKLLRKAQQEEATEHAEGERRAREALERLVHERLTREANAREAHERLMKDELVREKALNDRHRDSIQDLIAQERLESNRRHDSTGERIDALQRSVSREHQRLWAAFDSRRSEVVALSPEDQAPSTLRSANSP